jgi:hypothetical protein
MISLETFPIFQNLNNRFAAGAQTNGKVGRKNYALQRHFFDAKKGEVLPVDGAGSIHRLRDA